MPKSKGRKPKHTSRPGLRPARGRARYQPGVLEIDPRVIATVLGAAPPDQLVEMLPPMLWLYHSRGFQANLCVSAALTLHYAYGLIGITAVPTPADLVITDQNTGKSTYYGDGEPRWDGENYSGHCVLWLPASGRWIDTTVVQYPEVRASRPLPVIGRAAAARGGSSLDRAALAMGHLTPGTQMTVPRDELILDYTICPDPDNVVMTALNGTPGMEAILRNTGINLISGAVEWWRKPGIVERARSAPYPRLHALLDAVGDAPVSVDADDNWFFEIAPGRLARADELVSGR